MYIYFTGLGGQENLIIYVMKRADGVGSVLCLHKLVGSETAKINDVITHFGTFQ